MIAGIVLEEMAKGDRSIRSICAEKGLPDRSVIFGWVLTNPEFAALYREAHELRAHGFADDIIEISDTETDGWKAKAKIDARKWAAGKMLPRVYGEHLQIEQQTTLQDNRMGELIRKMTPDEREALRTILSAAAARAEEPEDQGVVPAARRIGR